MTSAPVRELLSGLASDYAAVRFASARALCHLSEEEPSKIYRHFDRIAGLLHHPNQILRWNGMRILANLAPVDRAGRLDGILADYLAPIEGPNMIGAAEAVAGAAFIAIAKPYLAETMVPAILRVESGEYARPECRNVAIGHALRACKTLAPALSDTSALRAFAERQLDNPRPATRRKAEQLVAFLLRPRAHVARAGRHGVQ